MSDFRTLPRLAAMYLTRGHRVPADVVSPAAEPPAAPAAPLERWEMPLDATRQYGLSSASGAVGIRPPHY